MLFTSLAYVFLRDFKDPPATSPPKIILISPTEAFLPSVSCSGPLLFLCCHLYVFVFCINFCNFPWRINISTWSFRCLQSSVQCPWSWWNLQYLFLSLTSTRAYIGRGHCRDGSSLICISTYSMGITKGVKLVNLDLQSESPLFLSKVCPMLHASFFLLGWQLGLLSLFLLLVISFAITTSSLFIYFWVCGVVWLLFLVDFW